MKKIILSLMLVALLSALMSFALIDVSTPRLQVTLINQDPDPAGPGEYVDLRFKIQNAGTNIIRDVLLEIDPEFPFSLDSNEDSMRELGALPAVGGSNSVIIVKYKVRVSRDAVEGENQIKLKYRIGNGPWLSREFDVEVRTIDATISIESVRSAPEIMKPGEPAKVKIMVKNMADSVVKDVTMKLDLTLETVLETAKTIDPITAFTQLPFAPLHSATEKKVRFINPGEEVLFTYDVIAYPSAQSRVYKVPIQLKFYDELDNLFTKNDVIGLVVGSTPEMDVAIDETELDAKRGRGNVVIKFVNKGVTDIKFLKVTLQATQDYEILSSPEIYIGNVDSDDFETAEFTLYVKGEPSEEEAVISLPVQITYRDANNAEYTSSHTLKLKLFSQDKLGKGDGHQPILLIALVFFFFIAWFGYRKYKKK